MSVYMIALTMQDLALNLPKPIVLMDVLMDVRIQIKVIFLIHCNLI
jgi:hypothetical protein